MIFTNNTRLKMPASFAPLTEPEQRSVSGGAELSAAAKAVVAVGVSGVLLAAAVQAVRGLWSCLGGGSEGLIEGAVRGGRAWIEGSLAAGQDMLDRWMGR